RRRSTTRRIRWWGASGSARRRSRTDGRRSAKDCAACRPVRGSGRRRHRSWRGRWRRGGRSSVFAVSSGRSGTACVRTPCPGARGAGVGAVGGGGNRGGRAEFLLPVSAGAAAGGVGGGEGAAAGAAAGGDEGDADVPDGRGAAPGLSSDAEADGVRAGRAQRL